MENDSLITKKKIIQDDFDRLAQFSVDRWSSASHYYGKIAGELPERPENLLDIGCGVGKFCRFMAPRAKKITGIDISPKMIAAAEARKKEKHGHIHFQTGDISRFELPEGYYDAIVSISALHHINIDQVIPPLKRALKPGGVLVIMDFYRPAGVKDLLLSALSVPVNWFFKTINGVKISPEEQKAMDRHMINDNFSTINELRGAFGRYFEGFKLKRLLLWYYLFVGKKAEESL